jgi:hypothetical protein
MKDLRGPDWKVTVSDGTARCMSDDCEGAAIPAGVNVHTRDGRMLNPQAYPNDPTSFCEPCITPLTAAQFRELDETEPSKAMLKIARHALGVISPNDLMFGDEKAERRVANVFERELKALKAVQA